MRSSSLLVAIGALIFALSGCGDEQKASWETQESARQQAIENATFNAKAFANANYPNYSPMVRGDSSITSKCPQGDGWGSVDLVPTDATQGKKIPIKCSTVSAAIGCMTDIDFKARPQYAEQDGHCNNELPFPLPKILK